MKCRCRRPCSAADQIDNHIQRDLREGDMMPPSELDRSKGERITLETFRGHPFVLTFIFTRCPIPNFCPLMSKNFAELQNAIKSGSGEVGATRNCSAFHSIPLSIRRKS